MGTEIEHKFLVVDDSWREQATGSTRIMQGYLTDGGTAVVRARVRGDRGYLTVKGMTTGITRAEYEYEIPVSDALEMLETLAQGPVIDKVRSLVPVGDHTWEVDEFAGANAGLIVAEVELASADQDFDLPTWAGADVSDDYRYFNVNLATHPYSEW
ncbi:MAG: CYTH domain-containing protein [Candidatus Nanopelagicales bacterium]